PAWRFGLSQDRARAGAVTDAYSGYVAQCLCLRVGHPRTPHSSVPRSHQRRAPLYTPAPRRRRDHGYTQTVRLYRLAPEGAGAVCTVAGGVPSGGSQDEADTQAAATVARGQSTQKANWRITLCGSYTGRSTSGLRLYGWGGAGVGFGDGPVSLHSQRPYQC